MTELLEVAGGWVALGLVIVGVLWALGAGSDRKERKWKRDLAAGRCPSCGAGSNQLCRWTCPVRESRRRSVNAPRCFDGLHHHCILLPYCKDTCVHRDGHEGDLIASRDALTSNLIGCISISGAGCTRYCRPGVPNALMPVEEPATRAVKFSS